MSGDRVDDALTDLRTALEIEPSPEFVGHVRRHLTGPPPERSWWPRLAWAGAAAVVVMVAGTLTLSRLSSSRVDRLVPSIAPDAPMPAMATANAPAAPTTSVESPRSVRPSAPHSAEVLIPSQEMAAMRDFLRGIERGQISLPSPTEAQVDADGRLVVLQIPLLVIEPLNSPKTGSEGGIEK